LGLSVPLRVSHPVPTDLITGDSRFVRDFCSNIVFERPPGYVVGNLTLSRNDDVDCEPSLADHLSSGFLSDWFKNPTPEEEDRREDDQPAVVDDSAPESHDEGKNMSSQAASSSSKPSQVVVQEISPRDKMVRLPEDLWSGRRSLPRPSEQSDPPEPLKGKACIVMSMQGVYQPAYHEFAGVHDLPKIHLFYFDEYTQSPFDVPPINLDKYLRDKNQVREKKRHKEIDEVPPMVTYCEICRVRIKNLESHRQSSRHIGNVARLDWGCLDPVLDALTREGDEI
jgi:hypothetical protein